MPNDYEFDSNEVENAFDAADSRCECCGKKLGWPNSRANPGWGAWEAHHGGRSTPVILCVGKPENCHLNCGHGGHFGSVGITPRVHRGG
ncbi:MAG: hypothetical protein ACLQVI_22255 [Polyangiaceae bacterium]